LTDWPQPPDQPLVRILFAALMGGPEPHLTALALVWTAVAVLLFVLIFVGVWVGNSALLGVTASGEISVTSGILGIMIGRLFASPSP
jgi:hypothetical protein